MKASLRSVFFITISIAIVAGCATTGNSWRKNLIGTRYQKETVDTNQTYFRQVQAMEADNGIRVSGYLRLKGPHDSRIPEYVQVALIAPNGQVLDIQKVLYYPRDLYGRKDHREGRFYATFAQVPPEGSTVRLENVN